MSPQVQRSFVFKDDPRFPEVHCSTIQSAPGVEYVTWFGGTKEGHADVRIWFSKRVDGVWSEPVSIAGEDGVVHWNPVSFLPDRRARPDWLIVFFKIGTVSI